MKNIYLIITILVFASACSSISSDANKVCECYENLNSEIENEDNLLKKASKIGKKLSNECIVMQKELTEKYAENSDDLIEFNEAVANCVTK